MATPLLAIMLCAEICHCIFLLNYLLLQCNVLKVGKLDEPCNLDVIELAIPAVLYKHKTFLLRNFHYFVFEVSSIDFQLRAEFEAQLIIDKPVEVVIQLDGVNTHCYNFSKTLNENLGQGILGLVGKIRMRADALSFFLHDMFFWFAIPKETHKID